MSKTNPKKIKVVYIMGAGRSGSTLLDTVLGNHDQMESVGELSNLARCAWVNNELCACGQTGDQCPFWTKVRARWEAETGGSPVDLINFKRRYARSRNILQLKKAVQTSPFKNMARQLTALYRIIAEEAGVETIVDSSKAPMWGLILREIPEIEFRPVHLIRDSRGVAWSHLKALKKDLAKGVQSDLASIPAWKTALSWGLSNLLSIFVLYRTPPGSGVAIRYEDFVSEPDTVLKKIGAAIGHDTAGLSKAIATGASFAVSHTVAGNRLRMAGKVTLKPDYEWKAKMSKKDRFLAWCVSLPLLLYFGYRW